MAVLLDQSAIMKILPHRAPFLLVDEVDSMEVGKHIVARKFVQEDEYWFQGHFPGYPVVPGVLLTEMMAQAGGICVLSMPENRGKLALLAGVNQAKFRRQVLPGDTLRLEVAMERMRTSYGIGEGKAFVGDELCAQAEIRFVITAAQATKEDGSVLQ